MLENQITTFSELRSTRPCWFVNANTKRIQEWYFLSGVEPRGPNDHFTYQPANRSYTDFAFYTDVGIGQPVLEHRKRDMLFKTKEAAQAYLAYLKTLPRPKRSKPQPWID